MRLCSVCDKKIEGTWCKNCRRFVKTYEISSTIYLNERHDPQNDKDCTYHTDTNNTVTRERVNSGAQRSYTSNRTTYTSSSASASGTNSSAAKKKGKKTALIVVIVYILISCIGTLGPLLVELFDNVSEGFREVVSDNEIQEDEIEFVPEELEEHFNKEIRDVELDILKPVYQVAEGDYRIDYYDPEEIMEIAYPCDSGHFDMTFDAFEDWLEESWTDVYEYVDDISEYSNYRYITDDYTWVQFSCYRDYYASDDFAIRVEYDTATEQVHAVGFVAREDGMDEGLCYAMLLYFEPDTEWTRQQFARDVEEAKAEGDYATLYYSEKVHVAFEMNEEAYMLVYYPIY